jgi:hypothetical protein
MFLHLKKSSDVLWIFLNCPFCLTSTGIYQYLYVQHIWCIQKHTLKYQCAIRFSGQNLSIKTWWSTYNNKMICIVKSFHQIRQWWEKWIKYAFCLPIYSIYSIMSCYESGCCWFNCSVLRTIFLYCTCTKHPDQILGSGSLDHIPLTFLDLNLKDVHICQKN